MHALQECQLKVYKPNPRQYTAIISQASIFTFINTGGNWCQFLSWAVHALQMPDLEVWFQRATDVVRKLLYGDVDIGIVGYDMFREIADKDPELVVVHDALGFGSCHLGLGVPTTGKFANITTLDQLRRCSIRAQDPCSPSSYSDLLGANSGVLVLQHARLDRDEAPEGGDRLPQHRTALL